MRACVHILCVGVIVYVYTCVCVCVCVRNMQKERKNHDYAYLYSEGAFAFKLVQTYSVEAINSCSLVCVQVSQEVGP